MPDYAGPEFCIVLFDHNNTVTFLERRALDESQRLVVEHDNNDTGSRTRESMRSLDAVGMHMLFPRKAAIRSSRPTARLRRYLLCERPIDGGAFLPRTATRRESSGESLEILRRQGTSEQIALVVELSMLRQEGILLFRFDAFGDD